MKAVVRLHQYDSCEFDGLLFAAVDLCKAEMLAAAEVLRCRMAATRCLGDIVTGDIIAQGRAVIQSIDARNQNPLYPPVFLTFLDCPQWIGPSDEALARLKTALATTPSLYRHFASNTKKQPLGGLFELNIYAALADAFPDAEPEPKIPGTKNSSDVRILVDGTPIYIESTVLDEAQATKKALTDMLAAGQSVWSGPSPGGAHPGCRILGKVAHELPQTAADTPNIICMSFFGGDPTPPFRKWAFADLWEGGKSFGTAEDGAKLDLSNVPRLDSIFEFGRDALRSVHVNPHPHPQCQLPDVVRDRIRDALGNKLMIR
jgi:hypothetical protein